MKILWLVLGLLAACTDAEPNEAVTPDAGAETAAPDAAPRPVGTCGAGTYTTAPSGATCDPKRVQHAQGLAGNCYGPPIGTPCGDLVVSVDAGDEAKVAAGFVCAAPSNGTSTCTWSFGDAAPRSLDTTALEAACATTSALPAAIVVCVSYGD